MAQVARRLFLYPIVNAPGTLMPEKEVDHE